jgi:tripartite-type tricarboxylate transporter receptor subunit TctC
VAVFNSAEFKEKISSLGLQPYFVQDESFRALMQSDSARTSQLVREARITAD